MLVLITKIGQPLLTRYEDMGIDNQQWLSFFVKGKIAKYQLI